MVLLLVGLTTVAVEIVAIDIFTIGRIIRVRFWRLIQMISSIFFHSLIEFLNWVVFTRLFLSHRFLRLPPKERGKETGKKYHSQLYKWFPLAIQGLNEFLRISPIAFPPFSPPPPYSGAYKFIFISSDGSYLCAGRDGRLNGTHKPSVSFVQGRLICGRSAEYLWKGGERRVICTAQFLQYSFARTKKIARVKISSLAYLARQR